MAKDLVRLRGWKSIAAYLNVTQSTAMRWARDADFPISRSPNGGSVYAHSGDLDAWLAGRSTRTDQPPADLSDQVAVAEAEEESASSINPASQGTEPAAPARRKSTLSRLALFLGLPIATVLGLSVLSPPSVGTSAPAPSAEAAAMIAAARQEWAERTPAGLARSIAAFKAVIVQYPDLPDGFTGLADSYLLSCEYAAMPRAEAFARARAAVTTALALAPADPDAHRIRGFLNYWTDHDVDRAIPDFEAAVASNTPGYLAPLWYGNVLIDGGRAAAGLHQLDRALAIAPDSPAVLTDHAIALWQSGKQARSLQQLAEIERRFPQHSPAPGWAALFHLSRGETAEYLRASERWAELVADPVQVARVTRERAAFERGGSRAMLRLMADQPALTSAFWHGGLMPSAIAASLLHDRVRLMQLLNDPRVRGQYWRPLPFPATAFRRWQADHEMVRSIEHALHGSARSFWGAAPA